MTPKHISERKVSMLMMLNALCTMPKSTQPPKNAEALASNNAAVQ